MVMDMHTTTADGGIFTIATEDPESVRLATALHAPVILGMLSGLEGTTMHYFHRDILHRDIMTFAFEAGRHEDPVSMNRSIAAIIACLRAMGMVQPEDVANVHDNLLIAYSEGLPQIAELIEVYKIKDQEQFALLPGFLNFQPVQKGQTLAYDCGEAVVAKEDGLILMPRYQQQGDDECFGHKDFRFLHLLVFARITEGIAGHQRDFPGGLLNLREHGGVVESLGDVRGDGDHTLLVDMLDRGETAGKLHLRHFLRQAALNFVRGYGRQGLPVVLHV